MKYLKIKNDGLLDIRLVYLMGGTTKSDDKYKIGQFGTGLKYTLAYMLRNNIDFKIFIDGKEVELSVKTEIIRDTEFNIICINGDKTSITTNMGKDWKAWMIIRELWCNALDESGAENSVVDEIISDEGCTEYYIQLIPDIMNVLDNWSKYFIHDKTPIMENDKYAIYEGGESLRCYKSGVLIKEITGKKSIFSYDIKDAGLNELREMKYSVDYEIAECMPTFDKKTIDIFLSNIKGTYEEGMDYSGWFSTDYGSSWKECIGNAKIIDEDNYSKIIGKYPDIEKESLVIVPSGLYKKLANKFPGISILRSSDKMHDFFETYSDTLNDKVKECIQLLDKVGYFIDPNLKIIFGVFGDKEVIAQVSLDAKEIRISQELESLPNSDLIVALIEENEHYKTGMKDLTREFQTHFIKLYSNLLLKDVSVLL